MRSVSPAPTLIAPVFVKLSPGPLIRRLPLVITMVPLF